MTWAWTARDPVGYDIIVGPSGQSNACGAFVTDGATDVLDSRLFEYPYYGANINTIFAAADPLHHPPPVPPFGVHSGAGPGMALGRAYAADTPGRRVLMVPMGWPGTSFESSTDAHWKVGVTVPAQVNLYEELVTRTQAALELAGPGSRLIAVPWSQGENDATRSTPQLYQTNLLALIDGLRARLDEPELPFLICSIAPSRIASLSTSADIDRVHAAIPYLREHCAYFIGSTLEDGLHYTLAGARANGVKFREALTRAAVNVLGTPPVAAASVSIVQNAVTPTTIDVTWTPAVSRVVDYLVQYRMVQSGAWLGLDRWQSIKPTASITGIAAGSLIEVRVRTFNETGMSAPSPSALIASTV